MPQKQVLHRSGADVDDIKLAAVEDDYARFGAFLSWHGRGRSRDRDTKCVIIEQVGVAATHLLCDAALEQFLFYARIQHSDGDHSSDYDDDATS